MVKHTPLLTHTLATTEPEPTTINSWRRLLMLQDIAARLNCFRLQPPSLGSHSFGRRRVRCLNPGHHRSNQAKERWIRTIQQNCFLEEFKVLKSGCQIKSSRLIAELNLFLDKENLIHCGGRVDSADILEGAKSLLLLPTRFRFTTLLVHHLIFHNDIRETLNGVKERYWIIRGREAVKQVLKRCIVCRKYQGYGFSTSNVAGLPPD